MQVVILAAGSGERMKPLTETMSKVMIPIANKPLLEWTANAMKELADEIILVVRKEQKDIIEKFPQCEFVYQDKPLGTAHAIACCEGHVSGKFLVMMGDDYIAKEDIEKLSKENPYCAGYFTLDDTENFGVFVIENNKIIDIIEKPKTPESNMANCGIYLFDERIFDAIKKTKISERGEYEITDALKLMIKEGIEIKAVRINNWQPVGYPWHLLNLNRIVLDKTGNQIGKVEILSGVHIEEPVAIGDGSIIGPNCNIRKYSSIGKNCMIGNATEVKNSIVMDNSHVPHLNYVGDSIIGRNCNLAAGTIFANLRLDENNIKMMIKDEKIDSGKRKLGCIVGDNVKFGVNVTVMPGKKIWPNLLIPPCITIKDDLKEQPVLK